MESVLERIKLYDDSIGSLHEEYYEADDEDVMKISQLLIEKHRRAYIALANA